MLVVVALTALLALGPATLSAQNTSVGACLDALTGRNNNCTANDVRVGLVNVSSIDDGCINFADTTTLTATARIEAGPERYDIGIFVALDSQSAKTGPTCLHAYLYPPLVPLGSHDPLSGTGPFATIDGDQCGDVGATELTFLDLPQVTIPCTDDDLNGFLDMATCSSWDNISTANCASLADALPGTRAKCNCELSATDVDIPNIILSKSCDPSVITPGETATCTVTYNNTGAGFGDFISFVDDYDETQVTISNLSGPAGDTISDSGAAITWTPGGAPATADNIAPSEIASITYDMTIVANPLIGPVCNTATAYWQGMVQPVSVEFCFATDPTPAIVSSIDARQTVDGVEVEWRTASEAAVLGFELYRGSKRGQGLEKVSSHPLPAALDGRGRRYRVLDLGAPSGKALTYHIEELGLDGTSRWYGPFAVVPRAPGRTVEDAPAARRLLLGEESSKRAAAARRSRATGPRAPAGRVKIEVAESGIHLVSVSDLAAAFGEPEGVVRRLLARRQLSLTNAGRPIAWAPDPRNRGFIFYGEASDNHFAARNLYWLAPGAGLVMDEVPATRPRSSAVPKQLFAERLHAEQDALAGLFTTTDPESDYWYWAGVFSGVPGHDRAALDFELFDAAPHTRESTLTIQVEGLDPATPIYEAELILNGISLGLLSWEGAGTKLVEASAVSELYRHGVNSLEVEGRHGVFLIDSVTVAYQRRLRAVADRLTFEATRGGAVTVGGFSGRDISIAAISDAARPRLLRGLQVRRGADGGFEASFEASGEADRFVATSASALLAPAAIYPDTPSALRERQAEYLLIAPGELTAAADLLAEVHRGRGLTVEVVDIEDIYDEFNHGLPHPRAVRDYLVYGARTWTLAPRFVLFLGKGSYDYRDLLGHGTNLLPVMMRADPGRFGLVSSDNAFADFDGDGVPELAIGRLPIVDEAEFHAYLGKRADYLAWPSGEGWNRGLLLADNPDASGNFHRDAATLEAALGDSLELQSHLLRAGASAQEIEAMRLRLAHQLQEGRHLMLYLGHGGLGQLTAEGVVRDIDVAGLGNREKPTVFMGLTCYVGAFHHPQERSLGERLLVEADGGAISAWSGSGLSDNRAAVELGEAVLESWASGAHASLGEVLRAGIATYIAGGGDPAVAGLFNLLGDPATGIR